MKKEEVKLLLKLINKELTEKGLVPFQQQAYSKATALPKWSENTMDTRFSMDSMTVIKKRESHLTVIEKIA